jgi:hypothetical protein
LDVAGFSSWQHQAWSIITFILHMAITIQLKPSAHRIKIHQQTRKADITVRLMAGLQERQITVLKLSTGGLSWCSKCRKRSWLGSIKKAFRG